MLFQLTMTLILILLSQLFPFVAQLFLIFLICVGLESDFLFLAVRLSLFRKPEFWCGSSTGVSLSVCTINLTVWFLAQFCLGQPVLPGTAWAWLGLAQESRQAGYGRTSPCFEVRGRG